MNSTDTRNSKVNRWHCIQITINLDTITKTYTKAVIYKRHTKIGLVRLKSLSINNKLAIDQIQRFQ